VEERALHVFPTDGMAMDFPYARSVVVVRSRRTEKRTQKTTEESRYYVSSLDPGELTPAGWHGLIRGHWAGVENRNHWRRDALFGEDRSRSRNTRLLTNLALLRNALLRLLPRSFPGESVPVIRERLQSNPALALDALNL
jgi:predicted transposase YbfD/YdcC